MTTSCAFQLNNRLDAAEVLIRPLWQRFAGGPMHPGFWEKVADLLFWIQLCWVVVGFLLMAYLAIKVFPKATDSDLKRGAWRERSSGQPPTMRFACTQETASFVAGSYRLEAFPEVAPPGKVIDIRSIIPEKDRDRRLS